MIMLDNFFNERIPCSRVDRGYDYLRIKVSTNEYT